MPPVLLRTGGLDELGANAEAEPPDAELREAAERTGGNGRPIIRADPLREPVGAEEPTEDVLGRLEPRAVESLTGQEIARVGVLDGERPGMCSASSTKRWRSYMGDVTLQGIGASSEAPRLRRCHPSGENKLSPIS